MAPRFLRLRFGAIPLPLLVTGIWALLAASYWWTTIRMPGVSSSGESPQYSPLEKSVSLKLEHKVRHLASTIGERNLRHPKQLQAAADWIVQTLSGCKLAVSRLRYQVEGQFVENIEVIVPASAPARRTLVVGAHYDSAIGTPGANDNATGVAALLHLACRPRDTGGQQSIRFVWFTNEEPPYFHTDDMGSLRYAQYLKEQKIAVSAMLSLETMGYYSEDSGSQHYPAALAGLFPDQGNFVAFVGDSSSRDLVRGVISIFRDSNTTPSEGIAMSREIQGLGWSDHWSFWQIGVPALMITDTAAFRYQHYHKDTDTPEQVDYEQLARVTLGVGEIIERLSSKP